MRDRVCKAPQRAGYSVPKIIENWDSVKCSVLCPQHYKKCGTEYRYAYGSDIAERVKSVLAQLGLGLAWLSGIHPATAILATSPGGIAEMSLTAKTLQLGVSIVTAFHVTRMAVLVMMIGPLFRSIKYLRRRTNKV